MPIQNNIHSKLILHIYPIFVSVRRYNYHYKITAVPHRNYFTETSPETVSFDRMLYEGTIQDGAVQHDPITVTGYSGSNIEISGGGFGCPLIENF